MHNLKPDIGQYLRLFKPVTLVDAFNSAIEVKDIGGPTIRKSNTGGGNFSSPKPLLPPTKGFTSHTSLGFRPLLVLMPKHQLRHYHRKRWVIEGRGDCVFGVLQNIHQGTNVPNFNCTNWSLRLQMNLTVSIKVLLLMTFKIALRNWNLWKGRLNEWLQCSFCMLLMVLKATI